MVIMDSYKLAVGDFEPVQEAFVDNTEYEVYFWIIFFLGTILSLILLLNMVIAVMSMSLENVVNDQEALVYREKLMDIVSNIDSMPNFILRKFRENKYLYVIEVDPQLEIDSHFDQDQTVGDELANEQKQQVAMQAQLEIFQAQILSMIGQAGKRGESSVATLQRSSSA